MNDPFQAFGRGLIKVFVSLLAGSGVALLVIGNAARDDPQFWRGHDPPGGFFAGLGSGLLTVAALLIVLFFIPWWWQKPGPRRERKDSRELD